MRPAAHIAEAIRRAMRARDGRGQQQAERLCAAALGGSAIDRHCAAAARRIGQWLATAHVR